MSNNKKFFTKTFTFQTTGSGSSFGVWTINQMELVTIIGERQGDPHITPKVRVVCIYLASRKVKETHTSHLVETPQ